MEALEWASVISDPEVRDMAAEAGELLLRIGAQLPGLEERALTKKETRYYRTADAMYSQKTGKVIFNKPRLKDVHKVYGSYKNYEETLVRDGWLSQPNLILHELGHYLDHYFGKEQPDNRIGDLFSRLDEKKVESDVSGYAATSKEEFMAELYSGILSGKVYPEEYLKAANLDYYTKVEIARQLLSMASGEVPNTTALQQQWGDMIHAVYKDGGVSFKLELLANPEVEKFIGTHAQVLDNAFALTNMSDTMRQRLQESDWMFSGMKTFHELNEAFPSLIREDGSRKPFKEFLKDVQKVDKTYNGRYLRAEYNFANASADMAARWERFEDSDRYLLQYRTQNDGAVRPEHAALHGVTLPASDSFWDTYYPPNGWNCRCTVVQVLRDKYPETDHNEAMRLGREAMTKDTKGMFSFNPGKQGKVFPAYNPYTISRCATCDKAKLNLGARIPDNEVCTACDINHNTLCERSRDAQHITTAEERHEIYSKPIDEQFESVYNNGNAEVVRHILKSTESEDYKRVLDVARAMAVAEGGKIWILPEIHKSETEFRKLLGLPTDNGHTPDIMRQIGHFVDVKSPESLEKLSANACKAFKQGAVACITDHSCEMSLQDIHQYAKWILGSQGYHYNEVYFYIDDILIKKAKK